MELPSDATVPSKINERWLANSAVVNSSERSATIQPRTDTTNETSAKIAAAAAIRLDGSYQPFVLDLPITLIRLGECSTLGLKMWQMKLKEHRSLHLRSNNSSRPPNWL